MGKTEAQKEWGTKTGDPKREKKDNSQTVSSRKLQAELQTEPESRSRGWKERTRGARWPEREERSGQQVRETQVRGKETQAEAGREAHTRGGTHPETPRHPTVTGEASDHSRAWGGQPLSPPVGSGFCPS